MGDVELVGVGFVREVFCYEMTLWSKRGEAQGVAVMIHSEKLV